MYDMLETTTDRTTTAQRDPVLSTLLAQLPVGVVIATRDGTLELVNDVARTLFAEHRRTKPPDPWVACSVNAGEALDPIHWVIARPRMADAVYFQLLPEGVHARGAIGSYVQEHRRAPVHCAGLTARTATVRAVGGWCANPRAEDIELVAAISELAPGYLDGTPSWLYRNHDGQTVRQPSWGNLHAESYLMIHQRLAAARALGLRMGTN